MMQALETSRIFDVTTFAMQMQTLESHFTNTGMKVLHNVTLI